MLDNLKLYFALLRRSPVDVPLGDLLWYFRPWSASLKNGRSTVADESIWIVFKAKTFLDRLIRPGMRVFEYGAGGSTLYFLKHGCELISVEHNPEWFAKVQEEVQRHKYRGWKGLLRESDPGAPGSAATRIPGSYESQFPGYTASTFQAYATTIEDFPDQSFDLVVVDGRARVSCVHHAASKVKPSGWLVLDNSERDRYRSTFEILKPEAWRMRPFFGPGPYVNYEFWGTTFWQRTEQEKSRDAT